MMVLIGGAHADLSYGRIKVSKVLSVNQVYRTRHFTSKFQDFCLRSETDLWIMTDLNRMTLTSSLADRRKSDLP